MNIPDHISESLETIFLFKILKFFDADPVSWIENFGSGLCYTVLLVFNINLGGFAG